jgi:L-amino acid N-acyltransferase YncA
MITSTSSVCVSEVSTTGFSIRRATIDDLDSIAQIWCEGVESSFGKAPPSFETTLPFFSFQLSSVTDPYGYWVAEADGAVVGWQSLLPCRPSPISKWAYSSTYVSSQKRAKGLGRALLAVATTHAASAGLSHIEGFTSINNKAVIRIVESLGWQKIGQVPEDAECPREFVWVYPVPRIHCT